MTDQGIEVLKERTRLLGARITGGRYSDPIPRHARVVPIVQYEDERIGDCVRSAEPEISVARPDSFNDPMNRSLTLERG